MREITFNITKENNGVKIKDFLHKFGVSVALLNKLKQREDGILLNGKPVRAIEPMKTDDVLTIRIYESGKRPTPSDVKAKIIYEDEDIIVADKPFGMACHETKLHQGDALSNAVAAVCPNMGAFRSVFRLDRDTSGLVLIAKHELSASKLAGKIDKDYYAVICGDLSGNGTIDLPIDRIEEGKMRRHVTPNGQRAVTHWTALQSDGNLTLVKCRLETGRTHQIRVHFAHLGMPLLGDTMYGEADERISRQALHCKTIRFTHPITEKKMEIDCPFPDDFKGLI